MSLSMGKLSNEEGERMTRETIRDDDGRPWSKWKPTERFAYLWARDGFKGGEPETEFQFDPVRKWRWDYCWPEFKVAVEVDGFGYGHGAANRIADNNEKRNAAIEQGWLILVFDSKLLGSMQGVADAVEQVQRVLMTSAEGRKAPRIPR